MYSCVKHKPALIDTNLKYQVFKLGILKLYQLFVNAVKSVTGLSFGGQR